MKFFLQVLFFCAFILSGFSSNFFSSAAHATDDFQTCRAAFKRDKKEGGKDFMDVCRRIAEAGDADAQFYMWVFSKAEEDAKEGPVDEKQVGSWLNKAAENGHVMAQYEMMVEIIRNTPPGMEGTYMALFYGWGCVLQRQLTIEDTAGKWMWNESFEKKFTALMRRVEDLKKQGLLYRLSLGYMCWSMLRSSYPPEKPGAP